MWKKEDGKPQGMPEISTSPAGTPSTPSPSSSPIRETTKEVPVSSNAAACISQGIKIKGEVTGSEDLFVDGHVDGKVSGRDKVQLWSTGRVTGEVQTDRLAIEDGATLRGKVEAGKHPAKTGETQAAAIASPPAGKSSSPISVSTGTAAD